MMLASEQTSKRMNEVIKVKTNERTNEQSEKGTNKRTNERTNEDRRNNLGGRIEETHLY